VDIWLSARYRSFGVAGLGRRFLTFFCLVAFPLALLDAQTLGDRTVLHPPRYYPSEGPFAGEQVDTRLSAPPVELSTAQALSYFSDFYAGCDRSFSNVASGQEQSFFVVKVPCDPATGELAISEVHLVHENFDRNLGLMHGYLVFVATPGFHFEFAPQTPGKPLRGYVSRALAAGLEGLRIPGMRFGFTEALNDSLLASWNFYTLESVAAMTAGSDLIERLKTNPSEREFLAEIISDFRSPAFWQSTRLHQAQSKEAMLKFIDFALRRSLLERYALLGKTCNHAIEEILLQTSHPAWKYRNPGWLNFLLQTPEQNIFNQAQMTLGWFHPAFFYRRVYLLGYSAQSRPLAAVQVELFRHAFIRVIDDHIFGVRYGRQYDSDG
jgi:hypothetical protein